MITLNKKLAAELMLHYVLTKSNQEIFNFLEQHTSGDIFSFIHHFGEQSLGKFDYKKKIYDDLLNESRIRKNPLSDEELIAFFEDEKFKTVPPAFIQYVMKVKNNDYSNYDLENTIKPSLLEVTKWALMYETITVNLDSDDTVESSVSNICGKLNKVNSINYRKKSTELSMGNVEEIIKLIDPVETDMFLSTGYNSLDRLLLGRFTKRRYVLIFNNGTIWLRKISVYAESR
jgi:hypothetical protein